MRTLDHIPSKERRKKIAEETLGIYVPLAEYGNLQKIQEELEDLSFQILAPAEREQIIAHLHILNGEKKKKIEQLIASFSILLNEIGIKGKVVAREKTPYSIWRKITDEKISLKQVTDIVGIRLIVESIEDCYLVLEAIRRKYSHHIESFTDHISFPKSNHYQSLHIAIDNNLSIQIRTHAMDEMDSTGDAAHWFYKFQELNKLTPQNLEMIRNVLKKAI
jgi:(p)ppGpp synthase/HD superfamily hydrolase